MDKIKISFYNLEFYVKGETVICETQATLKGGPFEGYFGEVNFHTKVEAHPKDGDVFDVEIGKKVARAKAELDIFKQAKNYLNKYKKNQEEILEVIDDKLDNLSACISHDKKYLGEF